MNAATKRNDLSIDLLTVLSVGIISFILKNVIHEAVGHWVTVVEGWQPAWAWRLLLTVVGCVLYAYTVWFSLQEMKTLIGADPNNRLSQAFQLTFFPYLAGTTISSLGALFNPIGAFIIFTSTAAAFGGSSAFAWMSQMLKTSWFPESSQDRVRIERNWTWVLLASILALFHIFILGPGVDL